MAEEKVTPRIFLDTSAWLAFFCRPAGGTGEILRLARKGYAVILTSAGVLEEIQRNLRKTRCSPSDVDLVLQEVAPVTVWISVADIDEVSNDVEEKDRHIIAAAVKGKADFLVSFDRRHITAPEIKEKIPVRAGDAGECLKWLWEVLS